MTEEQRTALIGVLGQVHISDSTEEDLKAKEDISVRPRAYRDRGHAAMISVTICTLIVDNPRVKFTILVTLLLFLVTPI